jgi:Zn-finger nucleic acid-binding protein
MTKTPLANGHCYKCSEGHGTVVELYLLQRNVDSKALREIWSSNDQTPIKGVLPCPGCKKSMHALRLPCEALAFELDACRYCHLIWFDEHEFFALMTDPRHKLNRTRAHRAEKEIALAQIQLEGDLKREGAEEERKILDLLLRGMTIANPVAGKTTWALIQVLRFLMRWR